MYAILGYVHGHETHCIPCTQKKFANSQCDPMDGCKQDVNGICYQQLDNEGNKVWAITEDHEWDYYPTCGTCEEHQITGIRLTEYGMEYENSIQVEDGINLFLLHNEELLMDCP